MSGARRDWKHLITGPQLSELFVEALPSLRLSRPALAAELSEWRLCVAEHFIEIKKSGPASEYRIATLLLERLFVDGDEEVRQESISLLKSIFEEARKKAIDPSPLLKDLGTESLQAARVILAPAPAVKIPTVRLRTYWGLMIGFTSWIPVMVINVLSLHDQTLTIGAWALSAISLALGIRFAIQKKLEKEQQRDRKAA